MSSWNGSLSSSDSAGRSSSSPTRYARLLVPVVVVSGRSPCRGRLFRLGPERYGGGDTVSVAGGSDHDRALPPYSRFSRPHRWYNESGDAGFCIGEFSVEAGFGPLLA